MTTTRTPSHVQEKRKRRFYRQCLPLGEACDTPLPSPSIASSLLAQRDELLTKQAKKSSTRAQTRAPLWLSSLTASLLPCRTVVGIPAVRRGRDRETSPQMHHHRHRRRWRRCWHSSLFVCLGIHRKGLAEGAGKKGSPYRPLWCPCVWGLAGGRESGSDSRG